MRARSELEACRLDVQRTRQRCADRPSGSSTAAAHRRCRAAARRAHHATCSRRTTKCARCHSSWPRATVSRWKRVGSRRRTSSCSASPTAGPGSTRPRRRRAARTATRAGSRASSSSACSTTTASSGTRATFQDLPAMPRWTRRSAEARRSAAVGDRPAASSTRAVGTGQPLVELSRRFPESALVGVDLSREFLRMCDQNSYASEDCRAHRGQHHRPQRARRARRRPVIFSSVTHEIYSYSGISSQRGAREGAQERWPTSWLREGGWRCADGVSPGHDNWRMKLLDAPDARDGLERFAERVQAVGPGLRTRSLGRTRCGSRRHSGVQRSSSV